jgi:hypothetical protein
MSDIFDKRNCCDIPLLLWCNGFIPKATGKSGTLLKGEDGALCKEPEMVTYLISYELHKPYRNNDQLTGALRSKGARRILHSSWSLITTSSAEQVRSWPMQFLSEKDRVIICAVGEYASYNPLVEIRETVERKG